MRIELLQTVRDVLRADSDPVRQALIEHVRKSNPVVKSVWQLHHRLGRSHFSSLMVFLFGVKSYVTLAPSSRAAKRALMVTVHENARKQARLIATWIGQESVAWLRLGPRQLLSPSSLGRLLKACFLYGTWMRLYRVVDRLNRREEFLVGCRAASALFCYVRAREILGRIESSGVIVSSDSNPEPLAFARAATALGIPTIFISHAYPTPVSPCLQYTLSILEGEAARQGYEAKGPIRGRVIFCGAEGESEPMQPQKLGKKSPTIGIFAPKVIRWPQFTGLIADCQRLFTPARILIRWHPSMLGESRLTAMLEDMSNVVETNPDLLLQEVVRQCDWVIADENSNVHLGVLKMGVPTVSLRDFSVLPECRSDLYGFVKGRVIPPPVASLNEISMQELTDFFSQDWAQRFGSYDANYLNSPAHLADKAREEILRVLAGNPPPRQS